MSDRIALRSFNPSSRLAGHGLRAEGKVFEDDGNGGTRRKYGSYDNFGFGLCSCGSRSSALYSDAARKRWHREHKEQVRNEPAKETAL